MPDVLGEWYINKTKINYVIFRWLGFNFCNMNILKYITYSRFKNIIFQKIFKIKICYETYAYYEFFSKWHPFYKLIGKKYSYPQCQLLCSSHMIYFCPFVRLCAYAYSLCCTLGTSYLEPQRSYLTYSWWYQISSSFFFLYIWLYDYAGLYNPRPMVLIQWITAT